MGEALHEKLLDGELTDKAKTFLEKTIYRHSFFSAESYTQKENLQELLHLKRAQEVFNRYRHHLPQQPEADHSYAAQNLWAPSSAGHQTQMRCSMRYAGRAKH